MDATHTTETTMQTMTAHGKTWEILSVGSTLRICSESAPVTHVRVQHGRRVSFAWLRADGTGWLTDDTF